MTETLPSLTPPEGLGRLATESAGSTYRCSHRMEYEYVGHPQTAINLPWMEAPDWQINPSFIDELKTLLAQKVPGVPVQTVPCYLLCRSGKRSEAAGQVLKEHGFEQVFNIAEGFEGDRDGDKHRNTVNGWRYHGLPWEQS